MTRMSRTQEPRRSKIPRSCEPARILHHRESMPHFDRFDVCEAYHCFAVDYHAGQGSPEYTIFTRLARMRFRPSSNLNADRLTENGRAIYDQLAARASTRRDL